MIENSLNHTNRTHILKRHAGWAVKKEGAQKAVKVFSTKEEAIEAAEKFRKSGSDIVIHKKDGSIERWVKGI